MVSGSDLSGLEHEKGTVEVGMPVEVESCELSFDSRRRMRPMLLLYGKTDQVFGDFPDDIANVILDSPQEIQVALDFTDDELSELAYLGFYHQDYELPEFFREQIYVLGQADYVCVHQPDFPILVVDVQDAQDLPVQLASDVVAKDSVLEYFPELVRETEEERMAERTADLEYEDLGEEVLDFGPRKLVQSVVEPVDAPDEYQDMDTVAKDAADAWEDNLPPKPGDLIRQRDQQKELMQDVVRLSDDSFTTASPITYQNVEERLDELGKSRRKKVYDSQMPEAVEREQLVSTDAEGHLVRPKLAQPVVQLPTIPSEESASSDSEEEEYGLF